MPVNRQAAAEDEFGPNGAFGLTAKQRWDGIVRREEIRTLIEAAPAMAKSKQKIGDDFDAILAGFAQQPAKAASRNQARRPSRGASASPEGDAPRPEYSARSLFKKISFPWPATISAFVGSFGRRPQDAYDETAAETKPAPQSDPPSRDPPPAAQIDSPKPAKTEDESIAEELGLNPKLGSGDLKRIRRDFAKKNHPDRFGPAQRLWAERRMAIANMLIDELMRQCRAPR